MRCCSSNSLAWSVFVCISSLCVIGVIDFVHRSVNGPPYAMARTLHDCPFHEEYMANCKKPIDVVKVLVAGGGRRRPEADRAVLP
jgi:hypothetical protein